MLLQDFIRHHAQLHLPPVLTSCCLFLAVILYCWVAEFTELFEHVTKRVDPRPFLVCVVITTALSLRTWTKLSKYTQSKPIIGTNPIPFLPREQTEEWKGWMQAVILLYHYFGLSRNLPIYQLMRVLVAAYIFLTGYSHTSYFLKSNDFSANRTLKTMLRLNLLSCVLAYAMNKSWDFYYFPLLTSIWYLILFVTIYYAKTRSGSLEPSRVSACLLVSCLLVQMSLYSNLGQTVWTKVLFWIGKVGGPQINARELNFRLKLDSLMPYWGALSALVFPKSNDTVEEWLDRWFKHRPGFRRSIGVHIAWLAACVFTGYFFAVQQCKDKFASNKWHPFVSIIPILSMLAIRSATAQQRQGFNRAFQWLGSISLETYILQSHLWLTDRNKSLLQINAIGRLHIRTNYLLQTLAVVVEKLLLTAAFLVACHCTAHATKVMIDWLVSGSRYKIVVPLIVCWMLNLHWDILT